MSMENPALDAPITGTGESQGLPPEGPATIQAHALSEQGDFNFDFNISFTEEEQRGKGIDYNYRRETPQQTHGREGAEISRATPYGAATFASMCGTDTATYIRERPGVSAFVLDEGIVYHTYSTYARGVDGIWAMYPWLDRAPKGRNEAGTWWKRHDEYGKR